MSFIRIYHPADHAEKQSGAIQRKSACPLQHKHGTLLRIFQIGLVATFLYGITPQISHAYPIFFTPVTESVGITHRHHPDQPTIRANTEEEVTWMSGGAAAEDFNGDGWIDLLCLQNGGHSNLLYINQGGTQFVNEAGIRFIDLAERSSGASAADFDNDGDIDVCLTAIGSPPLVLKNDGTGHFPPEDTLHLQNPRGNVMSSSWGDIDGDSILELMVGQWMMEGEHDQGLFLFRYVNDSFASHTFQEHSFINQSVYSPRFADMDNDRSVDLPITSDFCQSQLYLNNGNRRFTRVTDSAGVGLDKNGMGSAIGDYDNDGDLDWFVSSIFVRVWQGIDDFDAGKCGPGNRLYNNRGDGTFSNVTVEAGIGDGNWAWGASFADLDNDGDLDLFHVNGWGTSMPHSHGVFDDQEAYLYLNRGGIFTNVAGGVGAGDSGQGRGLAIFDYNRDGDLDIFIANALVFPTNTSAVIEPAPPTLLRNDSTNDNHWLQVTLSGTPPYHRNGIGSRVYVTTPGKTQLRELHASTHFLAQSPGRIAHFGLGQATSATEVRAEWISGHAVIRYAVPADQYIDLPSPAAYLSSTWTHTGTSITATATHLSEPHQWIRDGLPLPDPAIVTWTSAGLHELDLEVYEPDGTTLQRIERFRIHVRTDPRPRIFTHAQRGGEEHLTWSTQPGEVYQMQTLSMDSPAPLWTPLGSLHTATTWSVQTPIPSLAPGATWFRLRSIPSE